MASVTENVSFPIPKSSSEITPEWVKLATGHSALEDGFRIQSEIQEGIGFMSSMCRISYKTADDKDNQPHQIIVKLLPSNPKWLEYTLELGSDEREILFYTKVLPDLVQSVPEVGDNFCHVFKGALAKNGLDRSSVIVMEDLLPLSFKMLQQGGTPDQIIEDVIIFSARLHFGGHAIEIEKGIPLPQLYPFMQCASENDDWSNQIIPMFRNGFKQLEELLTTHGLSPYWEKFSKLEPLSEKIVREVDIQGRKYPSMFHGDLWPPNIQVHHSLPMKVIDWQLLSFRDPTFELCQLLFTFVPKDKFTRANLSDWLKKYYDEFGRLCKERGYEDKIASRRSWEEFEAFFFTWGIAYGLGVFMVSLDTISSNFADYTHLFPAMADEMNIVEFLLEKLAS